MSNELEVQYQAAIETAKTFSVRTPHAHLLRHGLKKQIVCGDINGPEPSGFNILATAKRQAWRACKGMTQEEAKRAFIEDVEKTPK